MVKVHLDKDEQRVLDRIIGDYEDAVAKWENDYDHSFDDWLHLEPPPQTEKWPRESDIPHQKKSKWRYFW